MIWLFVVGGFLAVAACGWAVERLEMEDGRLAKYGRGAIVVVGAVIYLAWLLAFGNPDGPR
jgi:hypothetical protein